MDKTKLRKFMFQKDKEQGIKYSKPGIPTSIPTLPTLPKMDKFSKTKNYFKK